MNKLIIVFAIVVLFISCKKTGNQLNNQSTITSSNSTINFSCIGKPVGKFGSGTTDIDGNNYKTVIIGSQEWIAENLKVTRFNNGTLIANIQHDDSWGNDTTGAWCYYLNNQSNYFVYGKLYNGYVVTSKNKVCPQGWHIPSNNEWNTLINFLGGNKTNGIEGTGSKMKEIKLWGDTTYASNTSLFTALPSGLRRMHNNDCGCGNSTFTDVYYETQWWCSDEVSKYVKISPLLRSSDGLALFPGGIDSKSSGLPIRCIKD